MSKRMIVRWQWYYSEPFTNLISINHEDKELNINKQIKVTNKHGSYLFDYPIGHFVLLGAIALTRYQRKKYRLKTYHSYHVEKHVRAHYHSVSLLLNEKFNFRTKVAGADDVFQKLSDILLPRSYPQNFVSQTDMHKNHEEFFYLFLRRRERLL